MELEGAIRVTRCEIRRKLCAGRRAKDCALSKELQPNRPFIGNKRKLGSRVQVRPSISGRAARRGRAASTRSSASA
jgi:hypothetical protein